MRRKLIAVNWKMNGGLTTNRDLLAGVKSGLPSSHCEVAVCVPTPYLAQCQQELFGAPIRLGAQDISPFTSGAYTGEVSASMLLEFDCTYVIVGHSERRLYHGESDDVVAAKAARAIASGLVPIICVGESLTERESGQTELIVGRQIDAVLAAVPVSDLVKIVIAYEPVWAIGTGKTATPEMAQSVHAMLRGKLHVKSEAAANTVRILYGGSMKPENAKELLSMRDIDGGLIGGASLKADDFLAIIGAA